MTTPLADALRAASAGVPPYDVVDAAIAGGRRRRRRAAVASVAAGFAVLALLAVALVPLVGRRDVGPGDGVVPTDTVPTSPSLPDRIGPAGVFPATVTGSPAGPAGLMFAEGSRPSDAGDRAVVVGATDDSYRAVDTDGGSPGRTALLSPDGGQVAYASGRDIRVADLRTGKVMRHPAPVDTSDETLPVGWLGDGSGIVALSITHANDPTRDGIVKELGIIVSADGGYYPMTSGTWPISRYGFTVAVSPDGVRVAFQQADFITVYSRDTGDETRFALPDTETALAGKGAWTPDGESLAVVRRDSSSAGGRRWELRVLDPETGAERDTGYRPSLPEMSVMRLVGWDRRSGCPVVVGIDASETVQGFGLLGTSLDEAEVRRIGVYELEPTGFRTLLSAQGVTDLDVADAIVTAGVTRPGHPPRTLSSIGWAAVILAGLVLAAVTLRWWWRQRAAATAREHRSERQRARSGPSAERR